MPDPTVVLEKLAKIELALRQAGLWQESALSPEQYDFRVAFAMDTMSFTQWLQFVFIPTVKLRAQEGQFPRRSMVAAQAVREFDGVPEADEVVRLLSEFDELFQDG